MANTFEVPETMRDFAEKSVEQARRAFEEYLQAAQKAVGSFETSAQSAQTSARALGQDAIAFAEENMAANFEFARRMMHASDIEDMLKVQADFIEAQMSSYSKQGQKLAETMGKAAMKAGRP
jgi:phasin